MSQIKALNLSLIKGAREVEHLSRIILLLRFIVIFTRKVSSGIKWTRAPSSNTLHGGHTHNGKLNFVHPGTPALLT